MTIRHHPFAIVLLIAASLGLAGCSGEPGEDDIRDAIKRDPGTRAGLELLFGGVQGVARRRGQATSGVTAQEFLDKAIIEKSGCKEAQGQPGYVCDFRMGNGTGKGPVNMSPPIKGRFFETNDGWTYQEMR
ncbi:hypothetical protein [Rhodobium gokarnense]|uniref:Lipoprotein n=1 Tax=Rhodobium gokarnense TaxID=364296 RepID=A0ABT3HEY0_9HYPH|nr:hypothetical protein [Rhodobium gokarnense]MCW2308955.1 hypothetical protein [Rhodobium gokarnense]